MLLLHGVFYWFSPLPEGLAQAAFLPEDGEKQCFL
jgi:hypothetical protein